MDTEDKANCHGGENFGETAALLHSDKPKKRRLRYNSLKTLFAMEYVLQGLANPFQGITYQPFFKHFRYDYGLSEAATQSYFSQSYLAWSFKPIIGFFMDAYGKTKVILTILLSSSIILYLITPLFDTSAVIFFYMMFILAMVLAATDVAVDRATVIAGEEESKETGRSKSSTVGLNQAICWAAIYGTSIVAAISGGYIADTFDIDYLMYLLALVPLAVLFVVFTLPKDTAVPVPIKKSVLNFWEGLHTGPIMWIILFYFLFHFQPAMGALWTNYLIEGLHFSQTQVGFADGASYIGLFLGVIIFAKFGIRWQEQLGLRRIFKIFILLSVMVNLTQYALIDPWFTGMTNFIAKVFPFASIETIRLAYLSTYNIALALVLGIIRMSTFSLVGAVIPVAAAGSLFAGFMSVSNIAYSFSYSSGAWLYDNGLSLWIFRFLQENLFGIPAVSGNSMSINLLIFIGSMAYFLSFISSQMLPDRTQTLATEDTGEYQSAIIDYKKLDPRLYKGINRFALLVMVGVYALSDYTFDFDPISATLFAFFSVTLVRKIILDWLVRKNRYNHNEPPKN